jgi:hypothetical protein
MTDDPCEAAPAILSNTVRVSFIAQAFRRIDSVTSLAIVWLLVKEGREAWEAEED